MHDVLIVLGYTNDSEDPVFQARVNKLVQLFEQEMAPQILMTGCCSDKLDIKPQLSEAAAMKIEAINQGIPPSVIMLEEESVDTLGNLYYSKIQTLIPCSWYNVGIISTPWHIYRTQWLAEMVLGPDYDITGYASDEPKGWTVDDSAASEQSNKLLLEQTQTMLKGITPGDHEQIAQFLGTAPKG